MNFREWMGSGQNGGGRDRTTIRRYVQVVSTPIEELAPGLGAAPNCVASILSVQELDAILPRIKANAAFRERNQKGHRMYSAALNKYRQYLLLAPLGDRQVEEDIQGILRDPAVPETERAATVMARIGQGEYRERLLDIWHGRCSVTGYPVSRMLVASHIKPWRAATPKERLDARNGLLLIPNLDRAFDQGLIGFDPDRDGRILYAAALLRPQALGFSPDLRVTSLNDETARYLAYHLDNVFMGCETLGRG